MCKHPLGHPSLLAFMEELVSRIHLLVLRLVIAGDEPLDGAFLEIKNAFTVLINE